MPARLLLIILAGLALSAAPDTAAAAGCDHVAAPNGADRDAGTESAPFRSPQRLADALAPGETGCLRAGTYTRGRNGYVARFARGGTPAAPVTMRSYPGERARLVGIVMVAHGADAVHLSGLDFEGTGGHNSVKIYAADVVVEDSDLTNRMRGDSCMMLGSAQGGRALRPIIRRNVIHDCGAVEHGNKDHGIYVADARSGQITDNVITNPVAYGIQLYPDARRFEVARNIINGGPDSVRGGVVIGGDGRTASRGNVVEHNVIANTATAGVSTYWPGRVGRGNVMRDNCTWAAGSPASAGLTSRGNLVANPRFRDPGHGDFRLSPGSACLGLLGAQVAAAGR